MMKSNIGLVFIDLTDSTSYKEIELLVSQAIDILPIGRNLVITWKVETQWKPQPLIEAWATQAAMGPPNDRGEHSLEFFGNGAIRTYKKDLETPEAFWFWLSFRRRGEKTYTRRKTASSDVIKESIIETLNPVFTRDAANNVWHVRHTDAKKTIRSRFQVLFSWSDELAVEVRPSRKQYFRYPKVSFSEGLIGSASKIEYKWG